ASLHGGGGAAMNAIRDEFLSEEDLDLKTLSDEALERVWNAWLKAAQAANEAEQDVYSHGVFVRQQGIDPAP
ncbi:MAG: hypothetical protein U1E27_09025, partial [Kiritimatiellia bacterium]|nr:hypothetical protein [Kiritimatiellia bacterium]